MQQTSLTKISFIPYTPQICKGYIRLGEVLPSSTAVTLASKLTSVACKPEEKLCRISIFHSFDPVVDTKEPLASIT